MFGIGSGELFLIFVVAVLVLGPEHLPRIMRTTQTVMSTFRKITTEFQRTLNLEEVLQETDSRSTTKRQSTTKKKKKKSTGTPTTTKKKTTKKSQQEGKSTVKKSTQEPIPPQTASHESTLHPLTNTTNTLEDEGSSITPPDAGDEHNTLSEAKTAKGTSLPKDMATSNHEAVIQSAPDDSTPSEQEITYPRPTEYISVTPQTQLGYNDDEDSITTPANKSEDSTIASSEDSPSPGSESASQGQKGDIS